MRKRNKRRLRSPARRRAYILIVVLGFTAIVTALGWAYLDAHGTAMPEAVNHLGFARSQYLAESGINIGMHFLMYPPTTVEVGDYWTGAVDISIDDTEDYTNVSIVSDPGDPADPDLFVITALGVAHGPDGTTVRGKHRITAEVLRPRTAIREIPYALLGGSTTEISSSITVSGDIHINGSIEEGQGWCTGTVSATGTIDWSGFEGGGGAHEVAVPQPKPNSYLTYCVNGRIYRAYTYGENTLDTGQAFALQIALDVLVGQGMNLGRVVFRGGNLTIEGDAVALTGTLVVDGWLRIGDEGTPANLTLMAVNDGRASYPALVVKEKIEFEDDSTSVTITGSVLCGEKIEGDDDLNSGVIGSCILGGELEVEAGTFVFTYDPVYSRFWNFGRWFPITVLSWQED